jgi:hypothetical protein
MRFSDQSSRTHQVHRCRESFAAALRSGMGERDMAAIALLYPLGAFIEFETSHTLLVP